MSFHELVLNSLEFLRPHQRTEFAKTSRQGFEIFGKSNTPTIVPLPARVTNSRAIEWTKRFHDLSPEMQSVLNATAGHLPCPDIFSSIKDENETLYKLVLAVTESLRNGNFDSDRELQEVAEQNYQDLLTKAKILEVPVPNLTNILLSIGIEQINGVKHRRIKSALICYNLLERNARTTKVSIPDLTNFLMSIFTACLKDNNIICARSCLYTLKSNAKSSNPMKPIPDTTDIVAKLYIKLLDPCAVNNNIKQMFSQYCNAEDIYQLLEICAEIAKVSVPNMTKDLLNMFIAQVKQFKQPYIGTEWYAEQCHKFMKNNARTVGVSVPDATDILLKIIKKHIKTNKICYAQRSYKLLIINAKSAMVSVSDISKIVLETVINYLRTSGHYDRLQVSVEQWYEFISIITETAEMPVPDITEILLNLVKEELFTKSMPFQAAESYNLFVINAKTVKIPVPDITNMLLNAVIESLDKYDICGAQICYGMLRNNAKISKVNVLELNITKNLLDSRLVTQLIDNEKVPTCDLKAWYELLKTTTKAASMSVPDVTEILMKIVINNLRKHERIYYAQKCYKLLKDNAKINKVSIPKFSNLRKAAGLEINVE